MCSQYITPLLAVMSLMTASAQVLAQELRPLLGKVVDRDGEPLAGAEVHCALPNLADPRHRPVSYDAVTTDARGRFRFNVYPCTYHLVWAIGPADKCGQRVCTDSIWTSTATILELRADKPRPSSKLTVKGLEGLKVLGPFRVQPVINGIELPNLLTSISEDGTCTLPSLPAGQVLFELLDKDNEPLFAKNIRDVDSEEQITVPMIQKISMRTIDGDGKPLAGATVRQHITHAYCSDRGFLTSPPKRTRLRLVGQTDAQGQLMATVAYGGKPFAKQNWNSLMFEAHKPGHATTHSGFGPSVYMDGKQVEEDDLDELKFTLPAAEPFSGQIMLDEGRSFGPRELMVRFKARIQRDKNSYSIVDLYRSTTTDANGRFEVPSHQNKIDKIDIVLSGDSLRSDLIPADLHRRAPYRGVCIHNNRVTDGQKIDCNLDDMHRLELQFLDDTGGPAYDVDVIAVSRKTNQNYGCDSECIVATPDRAGRLALLAEAGKWMFFARNKEQMVFLNVNLKGDQKHELRLTPMPVIFGKAVDEDGKPVSGAQLRWYQSSSRGSRDEDKGPHIIASALNTGWISATRTGTGGNFRCAFLDLPSRTYKARFWASKMQSDGFSVAPNEEALTIEMKSSK